jgi:hypothetical protein
MMNEALMIIHEIERDNGSIADTPDDDWRLAKLRQIFKDIPEKRHHSTAKSRYNFEFVSKMFKLYKSGMGKYRITIELGCSPETMNTICNIYDFKNHKTLSLKHMKAVALKARTHTYSEKTAKKWINKVNKKEIF